MVVDGAEPRRFDEGEGSVDDIGVLGLFDVTRGVFVVDAELGRRTFPKRRSVVDEDEID